MKMKTTNDKEETIKVATGWTKEEEEYYKSKLSFNKKFRKRLDELNDGWCVNWEECNMLKYFFYINYKIDEEIRVQGIWDWNDNPFTCKSREVAEQLIEEFGDDMKKYLFE